MMNTGDGRHVPLGRLGSMGTAAAAAAADPSANGAAAASQRERIFLQRADADMASLLDNFLHLVNAGRINDPVRNARETFQMEVHLSRMAQAADSLLKLVSELKQTAVYSDFSFLEENTESRNATFVKLNEETEQVLMTVGEEVAASLQDLESHYYNSAHRSHDSFDYSNGA